MKFLVVVLLAAVLVSACGRNLISPSGGGGCKLSADVCTPHGDDQSPDPDAENYTSSDGLVKMYVLKFVPGRGGTVVPGQKAEIHIQIIYTATDDRLLTVFPTVVDDPSVNPGQPGRRSTIFSVGPNLKPGANRIIVFGTFSAPVAEDIPYVRLCGHYNEGMPSWCNINIQLGFHP